MRHTRSALFASLLSTLLFGACSQGGSPTGLAAEGDFTAPLYGGPQDPAAGGEEVSDPGRADTTVPASAAGGPGDSASAAVPDTAPASPTPVGTSGDSSASAAPAQADANPDSASVTPPAAAVASPETTTAEAQVPAGEAPEGEAPAAEAPVAEARVSAPSSDPVPQAAVQPSQPMSAVDSVLAIASQPSPAGTGTASDSPAQPAQPAPAAEVQVPGEAPAPSGQPAGTEPSAGAASKASASSIPAAFLDADFEDQSVACWNGNRTATSANRAGCGAFTSIGFKPFALAENGIAHSGTKAIDITYAKNEEAGGTNVGINADSVNVRAYYYFEPGFDFGQGMKIGRVSSFNTAKQVNDVDIILEVRSAQGANQCGITEMRDVGVFFNGAPKGADWGNATATMAFQRGRWYAVEYQVVLNHPGKSDGAVRLWVDGVRVAARDNLNIRGSLSASAKLNTVKIGGWYSNGANGNSACANPAQPSRLHMDDVAIAGTYIGTGRPLTAANP